MAGSRKQLKPVAHQAQDFGRVRDAHSSEIAEDYVELIADLLDSVGDVRAIDLAQRFGVTPATINNTIKRLVRDGLVRSEPYRSIFLTESGRALAEHCRARHRIVRDFLIALGIDPVTAESDAEGIEHHVSEETLAAFVRHLGPTAGNK
ncbi:MAG TPA: manganese-binding transcriptional regulator MntR [Thermohalobaculum sp.]|nr:manganese-binding transcriptional regulator MntR [Thermohalobaculum sp.]